MRCLDSDLDPGHFITDGVMTLRWSCSLLDESSYKLVLPDPDKAFRGAGLESLQFLADVSEHISVITLLWDPATDNL